MYFPWQKSETACGYVGLQSDQRRRTDSNTSEYVPQINVEETEIERETEKGECL